MAHIETAHFVDAIHKASGVTRSVLPFVRAIASAHHMLRGTRMDPDMASLDFLQNWHSSSELLQGVGLVHMALVEAALQPGDGDLSEDFVACLKPGVRRWLEARKASTSSASSPAPGAPSATSQAGAESNCGPNAASQGLRPPKVLAADIRFEGISGPRSLEWLQKVRVGSVWDLQDQERMSAFQHDVWKDTLMHVDVSAVREVQSLVKSGSGEGDATSHARVLTREADRLRLECDFNLREGIASHFRVAEVKTVLREKRSALEGFQE